MPAVSDGDARCDWARGGDPLLAAYHDHEWGVPLHDEQRLFELLTLEGAQAGLSWMTILRRREGYRRAFKRFVPERVAALDAADVAILLTDPAIIRNRQKVVSTVNNAQQLLGIQKEYGSFDTFVWSFVDGAPQVNRFSSASDIPAHTPRSQAMSRALRTRGFGFVGPTICYAFMQAAGLVNDHLLRCPSRREVS